MNSIIWLNWQHFRCVLESTSRVLRVDVYWRRGSVTETTIAAIIQMKTTANPETVVMTGNWSAGTAGVFAMNGNAMEPMIVATGLTRNVWVARALHLSSGAIRADVCRCPSTAMERPIAWTDRMSWTANWCPSTTSRVHQLSTGAATADALAKPTIATETTTAATGLMRPSVVSVLSRETY